jgi:large subunit ribosomal protein L16
MKTAILKRSGKLPKFQKNLSCPKGQEFKNLEVLGTYVLCSTELGRLTESQLEAARRAIKRVLKKKGQLDLRVFPSIALTKKPTETRMGKGKGNKVKEWVYPVRPGKILFELSDVSKLKAKTAFHLAAPKLSVKVRAFCLQDRFSVPKCTFI